MLIATDKSYGIIGREIGIVDGMPTIGILGDVHQLPAMKTIIGIIIGIIGVCGTDEPSVELIEATVERCCLRVKPIKMPLVD